MSYPYDLTIGPDHCLYVCEYGNHRVQKFSLDGKPLAVWGSAGRGAGQLYNPYRIWPSTAGARFRSSTPTTIACNDSDCDSGQGRTER